VQPVAEEAHMRLLHLPLSLMVISLLGYGTATGQERPDFSGTWVMDLNRSETAGQNPEMLRRPPATLTIAQSPDELVIDTEADGRRESVTYSFARRQDPPRPVGTSGSNDSTVQEALAEWKGDRLETLAVLIVNGKAVTKAVSRTLDRSGGEMTVETRLVVQHGYENNGANVGTAKDVFIKR
jgi:hypothetical protein